jgi:hypothetical protein
LRFAPHRRVHELATQTPGEINAWNPFTGLSLADLTVGITKVDVTANHAHPLDCVRRADPEG